MNQFNFPLQKNVFFYQFHLQTLNAMSIEKKKMTGTRETKPSTFDQIISPMNENKMK